MRRLMNWVSPSKCISENTSGYTWVDNIFKTANIDIVTITSRYHQKVQRMCFFRVSPITVLRDVYIYSQNFTTHKQDDFEFCLRCHWQCEYHQNIHKMCIVLVWVPPPRSSSLKRYRWLSISILQEHSWRQSHIAPNLYGICVEWRSSNTSWHISVHQT